MSSHNYNQAPYAPPMYPEPQDNIRPVPPVRAEFEEQLLPPVPRRMDKPDPTDSETRNQVIKSVIKSFPCMTRNDF
jgi:hypothetical protein